MKGSQGHKARSDKKEDTPAKQSGKREARRGRHVRHHRHSHWGYNEQWSHAPQPSLDDSPAMMLLEALGSGLLCQMVPGSTPNQRAAALHAARVAPEWLAHHMQHINISTSNSSTCSEASVLLRGKCMRLRTLVLTASSISRGGGEHSMVEIAWPVFQALMPLVYKPPQRLSSRLIGPNQFCLESYDDLSQVSQGRLSGVGVVVHLLEPIPGIMTLQQHLEHIHGNLRSDRRVDVVSTLTMIQEIALALYEMPNHVVHGRVRPASCYVVHQAPSKLQVLLADMGGTVLCVQGHNPGQATRKLDASYASLRRLVSYGYPTWQDDVHALCVTALACFLGPKHLGQYLCEPAAATSFWQQANAWVKQEDAYSWSSLRCSAGLQVLLAPEPSNRTQLASFRLEQLCAQPGGVLVVDLLEACCRGIFPADEGSPEFHLHELLDKLEALQRCADWMQQSHVHAGGPSGLPVVLSAQLWSDNRQTEASALAFYQQLHLDFMMCSVGPRPHTVLPAIPLPPPASRALRLAIVPHTRVLTTSQLCGQASTAVREQPWTSLPHFRLPPIKVRPIDEADQPHDPSLEPPSEAVILKPPSPKQAEQAAPPVVTPTLRTPKFMLAPRNSPLALLSPRHKHRAHHPQPKCTQLSPIKSVCQDDNKPERDQDKQVCFAVPEDAAKDDQPTKKPSYAQAFGHRRRKGKGSGTAGAAMPAVASTKQGKKKKQRPVSVHTPV